MFHNRAELLPEDETILEHDTGRAEESRALAADRSGRGLFQGIFSRPRFNVVDRALHLPVAAQRIWDEEDRVERCPNCTYELEDGLCNHCGWEDHDLSDEEESIGDVTEGTYETDDMDSEPDHHHYRVPNPHGIAIHTPGQPVTYLPWGFHDYRDDPRPLSAGHRSMTSHASVSISDDDEDDDDEDDNSEMDDFIDDDEDQDRPNELDVDAYGHPVGGLPEMRYHDHDASSWSYDSDTETEATARHSPVSIPPGLQYPRHGFEPDPLGYESGHVHHYAPRTNAYNIDYDSEPPNDRSTEDGQTSVADDQTNYDSDGSSVQEMPMPPQPTALSGRGRNRRVLADSDDEDEAENEPINSAHPPFSSDEGSDILEDSDDTGIRGPPQTSRLRQRRLRQRRAIHNHRGARDLSVEGQSGYGSYGSRSPSALDRRASRVRPVVDLTQARPMRVH